MVETCQKYSGPGTVAICYKKRTKEPRVHIYTRFSAKCFIARQMLYDTGSFASLPLEITRIILHTKIRKVTVKQQFLTFLSVNLCQT